MEINVNFEALAWCVRSKQRCTQELRSRFPSTAWDAFWLQRKAWANPSGGRKKNIYIYINILYAIFCTLWGDIGLARNMCKFQPHKPGPTQTPCAPPVRELWVACSATQELPTRPSYAPKTLEQKRKSVGTKKAVLEVLGQKKSTLDTQVTHWHTASKRCQPAWLQTYRDWRIDRWIGGR